MKRRKLLAALSLFLAIALSSSVSAQIEVSNDNNVGVGDVDLDSKLNVKNTLRDRTLRLHSNFDAPTIYGIENQLYGNTTVTSYGLKNNFYGTGNKVYGVHNLMTKEASEKYGVGNNFTGKGSNELIYSHHTKVVGAYNEAYGSYTKLFGTADIATGSYNLFNGTATDKYGVNNYIAGSATNATGVYNYMAGSNSAANTYGVRNVMQGSKAPGSYGVKKGLENFMQGKDFNEVLGTDNEIFSTIDNTIVTGTKNYIKVKTNGSSYGNRSVLDMTPTQTAGSMYGTYNIFSGSGTPYSVTGNYMSYNGSGSHPYLAYGDFININSGPSYSYGVHSTVPAGTSHYAGYFVGNVYANGTILSSSDERFKKDIKGISSAWKKIMNLKPKKYLVNRESNNKNKKEHFGFIAQELNEVFPELVQLVPQPGKFKEKVISEARVEIGPNGEKIEIPAHVETYQEMDGEARYAINYIGLIPQLVAALQEQGEALENVEKVNERFDEKLLDELVSNYQSAQQRIQVLETVIDKLLACTDCSELEEIKENGFDLNMENIQMLVYPNPARDFINLEMVSEKNGILNIKVFDQSGRLIVKEDMMLIPGVNVHRINSDNWISGAYFITTTFNGITQSQKVIIE